MNSWFKRLLGREDAPAPVVARAPASPAPASAPASAPSSPAAAGPAFGARRPLLDSHGRLAGYEFCLPDAVAQRLEQRADAVAHGAHAAALLSAMKPTLAAGRAALATLPLSVLARPAVAGQVPEGAMLVLSDDPFDDPASGEALAALRKRGARLGTSGTPAPAAQFVLIDAQGLDGGGLADAAQSCRAAAPGVALVATGIGNLDDLEHALRHGFDFATGVVDRAGALRGGTPMPAGLQRVCQLLNLVMTNAETSGIAAALHADVGLTYQLLRYANSPLLGLTREVDSVDQAVMLLGRDAIGRWLSMLLVAGADGRPTSRALQEIALARARLLEMLAPAVGVAPSALFTTGLLSLLDTMLRVPMSDALQPLNLAAPARQALVDHSGPWHAALDLAQALERNDARQAQALAAEFGGIDAVTAAADEAWRWAAAAAGELRRG